MDGSWKVSALEMRVYDPVWKGVFYIYCRCIV